MVWSCNKSPVTRCTTNDAAARPMASSGKPTVVSIFCPVASRIGSVLSKLIRLISSGMRSPASVTICQMRRAKVSFKAMMAVISGMLSEIAQKHSTLFDRGMDGQVIFRV